MTQVQEYALNWQVVLALIIIFTLFAALIKPILKLNTTITKLDTTLTNMQKNDERQEKDNEKEHQEFSDTLKEHSGALANHDKRIFKIERERVGTGGK